MHAERVVASLLRVANEDLQGARLLASQGNRNAIYLCEQSAEKIIRAVLTSEGQHAGVRHHLKEMVDAIPDACPVKPQLRAIEHLSEYATSYRYPTPAGRIEPAPSSAAFRTEAANVQAALDKAVARFKVDLARPDEPAGTAEPIR